ncbi:MAG: hypothetical protein GY754_37670 [bacterium]|nr:hypothetical protein [bacterium]
MQIVSGSGSTHGTENGRGNLIVGYNEARAIGNYRSGSNNLIIGAYHNYSSHGGLVAGYKNHIDGAYSTVSGGIQNVAAGSFSSVSGGANRSVIDAYNWTAGVLFQAE